MPRKKGTPKTGGRQKGSPNKATAALKECIASIVTDYITPGGKKTTAPRLKDDLADMLPVDRVKAVTNLAGFILPKQQALTIDEQAQIEADALTSWLETAPDEAVNAIAAKVLDMQRRNAAAKMS